MSCPWFELGGDAASAALRSAAPAILRGFPPPADVNFSASGSLRVDVSPAEHANIPLKLPNASLVRPAERQLPLEALIALLRDPQRPYNAYSRYLALTALPDAVRAQLPLDRLFALAGERVTAANVWLGDGGMRSDVHFDGPDNLLLQLAGTKRVLLLPPAAALELGYAPLHERRWVFDETAGTFAGTRSTGAIIENHATAFSAFGPPASDRTRAMAVECELRPGSALFVPALWSHAVASTPAAAHEPPSALDGLNLAVNLWYIRGMESFEAAIAAAPRWAAAHFARGKGLQQLDRRAEARAAYEVAAALRPSYFDAVVNLGSTLEAVGAVGEAEARYRGARRLRPTDPRPLHNLGIVLRRLRRPDEAAASFGAALALGPTFGAAHMALGNSRAEQARMSEACGHFARAVSLTPRDARPYTSLGRALRADGRAAEAEAVLEAARRIGRRAS